MKSPKALEKNVKKRIGLCFYKNRNYLTQNIREIEINYLRHMAVRSSVRVA